MTINRQRLPFLLIFLFLLIAWPEFAVSQEMDPPPPPSSSPATPGNAEPQEENYLFNIADQSFQKGDYAKSLSIFETLSDDGHIAATLYLAWMHERGFGVPKDNVKALKFYQRAADFGSEPGKQAVKRLSKTKPKKTRRKDKRRDEAAVINKKRNWYKEAYKARRDGDFDWAYEILKPLAEKGKIRAQIRLGSLLHQEGRGDKKYYKEAFKWYRKATESGSHQAKMLLAGMYKRGFGVKKNLKKAARLLKESTKEGNRFAPHHLAVMYEKGISVPKDKAKALKLYKLSGERGYSWGKKAYERLLEE